MNSPTIAVLGGYGDVGTQACRLLHRHSDVALRIGGRDLDRARALAVDALSGRAEPRAVDLTDDVSLLRFAAGCDVVLNCAGPSFQVTDRVATAAERVSAHYVDAGGDDALYGRLDAARLAATDRCAVLSAGLQPGLTGLFPRWLAAGTDQPRALALYVGVLDLFTEVAAADYVRASAEGLTRPNVAWRADGPRRTGPRRTSMGPHRERLPFFDDEVTVLPGLSTEAARTAAALHLSSGDFHHVLSGEQVRDAFDRIHALPPEDAASALVRASRLDLAGREPRVLLLAQVDGSRDGRPATRTALLRGRRGAELTGAVAGLAALAVAAGDVPAGVHYAADVLDPDRTITALVTNGLARMSTLDQSIADLNLVEEGQL
jgi:hypothetical protein